MQYLRAGYKRFQFLIGSLEVRRDDYTRRPRIQFQFLIGSLEVYAPVIGVNHVKPVSIPYR